MMVRVNSQIRLHRHDNDAAPRRAFTMASRWDPALDSPVQTARGADARTVLSNLAAGEGVSTDTLDVALSWLEHAQAYYTTAEPPFEGYRGPWREAAEDMREAAQWMRQLRAAVATAVPTELKVEDPA
jgi:hypothetical protein